MEHDRDEVEGSSLVPSAPPSRKVEVASIVCVVILVFIRLV